MRILELVSSWFAIRRAQRRWRDTRTILILVLLCALCNIVTVACGLIGYALQQIGILPPVTPTIPLFFL